MVCKGKIGADSLVDQVYFCIFAFLLFILIPRISKVVLAKTRDQTVKRICSIDPRKARSRDPSGSKLSSQHLIPYWVSHHVNHSAILDLP
jgi:hypothetical protein